MRNDIEYRVLSIISAVVDDARRSKALEEETGIPSTNWKNVWSSKQRPTIHMVEALARRWPQYAFWLISGITDEANGHTAPDRAWTCNQSRSEKEIEEVARDYFNLKIFYQNALYGLDTSSVNAENQTANAVQGKNLGEKEIPNGVQENRKFESKRQLKDLDYAIAQITFQKRQRHLEEYFFGIRREHDFAEAYKERINTIQRKRTNDRKLKD
jgi:hypothetical protein